MKLLFNMKNFFLLLGLTVVLAVACKNQPKDNAVIESTDAALPVVSDGHNAANSLDVSGTYKGTLPCEDCDGLEMEIQLDNDNSSYAVKVVPIGRKDGKEMSFKGNYTWNEEGNTVTLIGLDEPSRYFVGENILFQVGPDGKRRTGEGSDKYTLAKQ